MNLNIELFPTKCSFTNSIDTQYLLCRHSMGVAFSNSFGFNETGCNKYDYGLVMVIFKLLFLSYMHIILNLSSPEPFSSQGELIVYPPSRRPSIVRYLSVHNFQRSASLKPLGQSKLNFKWILLGKGEQKFV